MSETLRAMGKRLEALYAKKLKLEGELFKVEQFRDRIDNALLQIAYSSNAQDMKNRGIYNQQRTENMRLDSLLSSKIHQVTWEIEEHIEEMVEIEKQLGTEIDVAKTYKSIIDEM